MTTCKTCGTPLKVIGLLGWCENVRCTDHDAHYSAGPRPRPTEADNGDCAACYDGNSNHPHPKKVSDAPR